MTATLEAEPQATSDGVVLAVGGDLDIAAAPRLRSAVGDLMGQGVRHLEVDLEACTFIDSSGIGALLWAAHRLHAAGGDLITTHAHGAAERTLDLAGVTQVLHVQH